MKRKKNKKKIIFILLGLLLILIMGIILLIIYKDKDNNELNINDKIVINDPDVFIYNNFYIKKNEDNIMVYNFDNDIIYKYDGKIDGYEVFNDKYILMDTDNEYMVIDNTGNMVIKGINGMSVHEMDTNIKYIIVDNKLYDNEMKEIYELPDYFVEETFVNYNLYSLNITNDILAMVFVNNEHNMLVDIDAKKEMYLGFDGYLRLSDRYIAIGYDNKYKIIDTDSKKVIYDNVRVDENLIIWNNDNYMYIYNDKIYTDGTKINNKYHMKSEGCKVGSKLLYDNEIKIDECMLYYEEYDNDVIMGFNIDNSILYINGDIKKASIFNKIGRYIKSYQYNEGLTTYNVYDRDGKIVLENKELYYLGNDIYQEYDIDENISYFLDSNLNIISDKFNYASCNKNGYCIVSDNNYNKMLYKDGKVVTNNIYDDIEIKDNYITAKMLFNSFIYRLGNLDEINIDYVEEVKIDADEMIDKYDLSSIKDKIDNNKVLFNKYAYIVENNNNLLEYKKQVMDMFSVVIDNKEYLNELTLLKKLRDLNIEHVQDLGVGVAGVYSDSLGEIKIKLKERSNNTLYHELMHFIDYSFNNNSFGSYIYNCNGKYSIGKSYNTTCEIVSIDTNFITEAGAEVYSGKYFTKEIMAYQPAPTILEALEYICGSNEVKNWYFNNDIYFKMLWFDIGYSKEEVDKLIEALTSQTQVIKSGDDNIILIVDSLIDLYKYRNGNEFLNDNKFKYIIRSMLDYRHDFSSSKYKNELEKIMSDRDTIVNVFSDKFSEYGYYSGYGEVLIIDNQVYISISCYKDNKLGVLFVEYDFDNNKVLDYSYIEIK
jgi:hypothetical protein